MTFGERIAAFESLGKDLISIDPNTLDDLYTRTRNRNPWFTPSSVHSSLTGVSHFLDGERLRQWLAAYEPLPNHSARNVALVLAGNIPLVGFHDILCVLITGHRATLKLSSKDDQLVPFVLNRLIALEPRFEGLIQYVDKLRAFDAVIATGSDNTGRYFEYYFRNYPSIIRKNRTSCAILTGNETGQQISDLGLDVFTYFGLGCRNVSKIFVPNDYRFDPLLENWNTFKEVANHHKYFNNYEYQKTLLLINGNPFEDNGIILLTPNEKLVSPISVLYYDYYTTTAELAEKLSLVGDKIQCVVGTIPPANTGFGETQVPGPADYADGIDTIRFLLELN